MENYAFDLQRIFFGDATVGFLLEVGFRTTIMFLYLLVMLRVIGQRNIGQITMFEFGLIIALGSAAGDPMFYVDVPLVHGMVVITLITVFQRIIVILTRDHPRVERVIEGKPRRLVADGMFDMEGVRSSLLSREEIFMELRQEGIEQLGQVRRAFLELDGQVSVFRCKDDAVRAGLPVMPDGDIENFELLNAESALAEGGAYSCYHCGNTQTYEDGARLPVCHHCGEVQWIASSSEHVPVQDDDKAD